MITDGIEVYIRRVSKGTRYLEYEKDKPKYHSNTCVAYIRATTGEQFEVHIKLHQVFRYYSCSGLQIRLCIDANEAPDVYWFEKKHLPIDGVEYVLTDFQVEVAGEWQSGKLAFGEIGHGKAETTVQFAGGSVFGNPTDPVPLNNFADAPNPDDGPEFIAARRRRLGTIRVSIQRGNVGGKAAPARCASPTNPSAVQADKSSGITHQVTTLHRRRIATPEPDTSTNFKPVLGVHGERFNFEFRYRSLPELIRIGLCDENGRIAEPQSEPETEPEPEPEPALEDDEYDEDEEDGLPIPPNHRRISQANSNPPPVSSGLRTSSRLRAIAEAANRAALLPPRVPTPRPDKKRKESIPIKRETSDSGAENHISSADTPVRSIETPFPGTETHISHLAAVQRLPVPTPGATSMRPVKRRKDNGTFSPAPVRKPRLGGELKIPTAARPAAKGQQVIGSPSVSATRRPIPATTNMQLVRHGENIGTFMSLKPKQEPGSVSSPALSAAGPTVSTVSSVPGGQGVSSGQNVPNTKSAHTPTNAPTAPAPQSDSIPLTFADLEMQAFDIRDQLNEVDKKRMLLDSERARLQLALERIRAQQERLRFMEGRSAAGTDR